MLNFVIAFIKGVFFPKKFEDVAVQTQARVPFFVEKCVEFIETNGLKSKGVYRLLDNIDKAERIYQTHKEARQDFDLNEMNVSVYEVASALKFFFKRNMSLFTPKQMSEINDIFLIPDSNTKLLALRDLLTRLKPADYNVLMFFIQHLVKVNENAENNLMSAKNLATCCCPSILPMKFTDFAHFQVGIHQYIATVEAMIENFGFVFSRKNESASHNGIECDKSHQISETVPESDGITRGEPELKKKTFFQRMGSIFKNSAKKNQIKNSKTVEAKINDYTTSMVIDKKNYDSAISTELWRELGQPELQKLDEAYFKLRKRTGKNELLKKNDFKGYFMGVMKIGEMEHLFPILVFEKPDTPNFLGKRVFTVLQLDKMKNADFIQKPKKKKEGKKSDRR